VRQLASLGFTQHFFAQLDERTLALALDPEAPTPVARVTFVSRDLARLHDHTLARASTAVVVGDWVVVDRGLDPPWISRRLEPRNELRRRDPGTGVQTLAANVDEAWICTALGRDLQPRRVERFLALCHEAEVEPRVLLTKADPDADPRPALEALRPLGAPISAISALHGTGLESLDPGSGRTAALLGSSGVGKSTLLNALLGDAVMHTGDVREHDDRGRHTTTARHLFRLPRGGWLLDNPGIRQVGLVDTSGLASTFPEIDALLDRCRYRDCAHQGDAGCAVQAAVDAGEIDAVRLAAWRKLGREADYHARAADPRLQAEHIRRWKQVHLENRHRGRVTGWQKGQG
jgi:ribosome biogenesis GTPase